MDWIKWANETHENAVAHGWWDEERTAAEIVCLIHSELSEALEEYRNNRPMVYGLMIQGDENDTPYRETDMAAISERGMKPEGVAVELADAAIRGMDWLAHEGLARILMKPSVRRLDSEQRKWALPTLLAHMHKLISTSYEWGGIELKPYYIADMVAAILDWLEAHEIDFEAVLALKHEYNKTRPYRHGGKKL